MSLTVFTRSCNDILYARMKEFLPKEVECIRMEGYNTPEGSVDVLYDAIEQSEGVILFVDEDMMLWNWGEVVKIAIAMKEKGILFAGVPEGGVVLHRNFNPFAVNPSFVFFNVDAIKSHRAWYSIPKERKNSCGYTFLMEDFRPDFITTHGIYDIVEPFFGLFMFLLHLGHPLYLQASNGPDGIVTELKGLDGITPIGWHLWYSRTYGIDEANTKRMDFFYQQALKYKQ